MDITQHDAVTHFWCPQLGQTLHFGYCRQVRDGLPCPRVVACFNPHFDVEAFLAQCYTPEQRARFLAPAPGRLERLGQALAAAGRTNPEDDA